MATQPTNLPVPSESPFDFKFNAGKIDEFVTSLVNTYVDRFGNEHYTIEGLRWLAQQAIAQYGWIPVGTFQDGATLTSPNQTLKDTTDGEYYRWDGSFLPSGKVVPNGSTPGSTGGVGTGAWISVGDSSLRSMLASSSGAGMIGYDPEEVYGTGTVGGALEDLSNRTLSSDDFSGTDDGLKINNGLDFLRTQNTTYTQGGTLNLPRKQLSIITPVVLDRVPLGSSDEGDEYVISGNGKGTSLLIAGDGFPSGKALLQSNLSSGKAVQGFKLSNFGLKGGYNSVRIETASRTTIDNLRISTAESDGMYIGNSWVNVYSQIMTDYCGGHGVNFASDKQKTSTVTLGGYQLRNNGSGWNFGYMNYSSAISPASDQNGQHGYRIINSDGFVMVAPGAESNVGAGISAEASSTLGVNKSVLIQGAFCHSNNTSGSYANLLYARSAANSANYIKITDSTANSSLSTSPDIVADGNECIVTIDNCTLPNGWKSVNGGYINWVHHTLYVQQSGITGARAICNLRGTQGHGKNAGADTDSFAGELTIVASPSSPSTASRRVAIYKLLICVGLDTGVQCEVVKQLGYVSGNVTGAPSFTWSIGSSHELIATPIGSAAGNFFFEITTDSQVVALKR